MKLAVNECIEFREMCVKRKITMNAAEGVFFGTGRRGLEGDVSFRAEVQSVMAQQNERHSAHAIVPGMSDHAGAQSSATQREYAKHRAIRGDQQHAGKSFVAMRAAEEQRGNNNAGTDAFSNPGELLLQVAAKNEFFADSRRDTENQEQHHLHAGARGQFLRDVGDLLRVELESMCERLPQKSKDQQRDYPEDECGARVAEPSLHAWTALADQLSARNSAHADAPPCQSCQHPLVSDGGEILRSHIQRAAPHPLQMPRSGKGEADDDGRHQRGVPPRCYESPPAGFRHFRLRSRAVYDRPRLFSFAAMLEHSS